MNAILDAFRGMSTSVLVSSFVCIFRTSLSEELVTMHKYVGSKETELYHVNLPFHEQCEKAVEIDVADMVYFDSKEDAVKAGYKPCDLCILENPDHIC